MHAFPIPSFTPALAVAALAALIANPAQASCGSAFCSINTDVISGVAGLAPGSTFDLRYENIRQDQPRSGSRKVPVGEIPRDHDEVFTKNQNLVGTFTHTFASGWGVSLAAPLVQREHEHLHNEEDGQELEKWNFREIGDVRVTGRYQWIPAHEGNSPPLTVAAIFGLKLPTGRTSIANDEGELAERTLQPGSGTTDLIMGVLFHQQLPNGGSWFAQAQFQSPLNSHDNFRPGLRLTADLGYAHSFTDRFSGILQLNVVSKSKDSGANAEPEDSGGQFLFLSPGASYKVTESVWLYAYYQQPLYQHVNGVQLTASHAFVVGVTTRF